MKAITTGSQSVHEVELKGHHGWWAACGIKGNFWYPVTDDEQRERDMETCDECKDAEKEDDRRVSP